MILTAITLSIIAMTVIISLRYLVSSGTFAAITKWRYPELYDGLRPQIKREIYWSMMSAAIYGTPAGIVAWGWQNRGWTKIYTDIWALPLWYVPLSVFLYLVIHDMWFYWTHRLMHRPYWFKLAHRIHHDSRPPTAWAAMSFHPWEAVSGAIVIPALVIFIPVHVAALGMVLTVMTVMGIINHMGWEIFPRYVVHGGLGRSLITASHHHQHHNDYGGNYGLYFRFWDKICGTDIGLGHFGTGRGKGRDKRGRINR